MPRKGLLRLGVPGPILPRLSNRISLPALASVAAPQHVGHVGMSVQTCLGHAHVRVQWVVREPLQRGAGAHASTSRPSAVHRWVSVRGRAVSGHLERSHRLPLLVPPRKAPEVGCAGSPLASLTRFPPGAGLMERIQAIAQNVSDIAVKVDQILRHSLLLHSKGGAQGALCPQEASVLGGPDSSPRQRFQLRPQALSGVTWGSPHCDLV